MKPPLRTKSVGTKVSEAEFALLEERARGAGLRVAKGSITSLSCNLASNGFVLQKQYLLDQSGDQVTELNGTGVWQHSNVWTGAHLDATYDAKGLHFHLADPLGTRRVQTNVTGQIEATFQSLPFGDGYVSSFTSLSTADDATENHFTGKERDTESGNDYFEARYYSSSMGRFMSPDWSAKVEPVPYAKLENPQSLNLYGYVLSNPLIHFDSDGHKCDDAGTECWLRNGGHDKIADAIFGPQVQPLPEFSKPKPPKPPAVVNLNGHRVSDSKVLAALSKISVYFGSSTVNVTSGDRDFRPKGSPARSEHLFHDAADFHVSGMSDHDVKENLKAPDSPVFSGFDVIQHGPFTATEAPHVHLDAGVGQGQDPDSRSSFKHEGMTPDGTNHYTPEEVQP